MQQLGNNIMREPDLAGCTQSLPSQGVIRACWTPTLPSLLDVFCSLETTPHHIEQVGGGVGHCLHTLASHDTHIVAHEVGGGAGVWHVCTRERPVRQCPAVTCVLHTS